MKKHSSRLYRALVSAGVERASDTNQVPRQSGVDVPRACHFRVGQRVARNRLAAKTHVIQALRLGAQIDLDIAQRLSVGQLCEGHREELIQASEVLDFEIFVVTRDTAAKSTHGQMSHKLSEHELALMHGGLRRENAKNRESENSTFKSRPDEMLKPASKSLTYDVLM